MAILYTAKIWLSTNPEICEERFTSHLHLPTTFHFQEIIKSKYI